jgi:hypothetical protein
MIRIEFTSPKKNSHAAELGGSPKATFEHDPRHKTCLDGNGPLAFEVENHVVKYVQNLCKNESAQVVPRGAVTPHSRGRLTADPRADRNAATGSCASASARSALVSASSRCDWWIKY